MLVIIIGLNIISSALRILQFARVDLMYRPSFSLQYGMQRALVLHHEAVPNI